MIKRKSLAMLAARLLAVAVPNYGYAPASEMFGGAASRWHYILDGFATLTLIGLVAWLWRYAAVWAIALWGAIESTLKGVCGSLRLYDEVFAPSGYVCSSGEAWTIVGCWLGLACAILVWRTVHETP